MKIVVAPDSFKGSMEATHVADLIAEEVRHAFPHSDVVALPLADGGEGSTEALVSALSPDDEVDRSSTWVQGPAGQEIIADSAVIVPGIALLEVAQSSGITRQDSLHPMDSSTYGFGQLIESALDWGARDFLLCLGGSATTDAGCGMAHALGVRFFADDEAPIVPCGQNLSRIARIDTSGLDQRVRQSTFIALCDVVHPLYGTHGSAYVFGPQKGATAKQVRALDEGLCHIAERIRAIAPDADPHTPGTGSAGGLGFGVQAFLGAELVSGSAYILDAVDFISHVQGADLIITGEGRLDEQSFSGKVLSAILREAGTVPVVSLCGSITCAPAILAEHNVTAYALSDGARIEDCLADPETHLRKTVRRALTQRLLVRDEL